MQANHIAKNWGQKLYRFINNGIVNGFDRFRIWTLAPATLQRFYALQRLMQSRLGNTFCNPPFDNA
jgi:hypothetical protein